MAKKYRILRNKRNEYVVQSRGFFPIWESFHAYENLASAKALLNSYVERDRELRDRGVFIDVIEEVTV